MKDFATVLLTIVGGILTLALVAVIVGRNSKAPQAIAATGQFVSNVIAAAVDPAATADTNGNPQRAAFTAPQIPNFKF